MTRDPRVVQPSEFEEAARVCLRTSKLAVLRPGEKDVLLDTYRILCDLARAGTGFPVRAES